MQQSVEQRERFATVEEFLAAYVGRPGRYELVDGVVEKMPAETLPHMRVKLRISNVLFRAIEDAGVAAEVLPHGLTFKIRTDRAREPDVSIILDRDLPDSSMMAFQPVVLVEVVSPTSGRTDRVHKLAEYFTFPTLAHYLVVDPVAEVVTHHHRGADGAMTATDISSGPLALDPPGIVVDVATFWPPVRGAAVGQRA